MKTIKTLAIAALLVLSVSAFADEKSEERARMDYALNTYVNALSHGQFKALPGILHKDVRFTVTRNNKIYRHGRRDVVKRFKSIENIEQDCITDYSVVEMTSTQAIVKVTMKYDWFTKVHLVCLANASNEWKITSISSSFI